MPFTGKILLFLVFALAFTYYLKAQTFQFNCFQEALYPYVQTGDTNWLDADYAVIIDFEKKSVDIKNHPALNFQITRFNPLRVDKTGNTIVCNAIDNEGIRCNVELTLFRELSFHVATLVVRYSTLTHSYRLRNIKR